MSELDKIIEKYIRQGEARLNELKLCDKAVQVEIIHSIWMMGYISGRAGYIDGWNLTKPDVVRMVYEDGTFERG